MVEITPAEQIRLNLLSTLNYDTAAAAKAIEFVGDSPLKYQLFIQQYNRVVTETEVVARTIKALQESTEALALLIPAQGWRVKALQSHFKRWLDNALFG